MSFDYNEYVFPFAVQPMRLVATKCWRMQDDDPEAALQAAKNCRNTGACGPYESGQHTYPYRGLGDAKVQAFEYFAQMPLDLKHAVELEQPYNSIEFPMDVLQLVVYENGHGQWGGTADDGIFGSLVNEAQADNIQAQRHTSSTHEFGHTFGCTHQQAKKYDDTWSVMASNAVQGDEASSRLNKFSDTCAELILDDLGERDKPAGGSRFGF
jgi:hypothetical protein